MKFNVFRSSDALTLSLKNPKEEDEKVRLRMRLQGCVHKIASLCDQCWQFPKSDIRESSKVNIHVKNPQGSIAGVRVSLAILRGCIVDKSGRRPFAAFAMGHHPRLGEESQVPRLWAGVVRMLMLR